MSLYLKPSSCSAAPHLLIRMLPQALDAAFGGIVQNSGSRLTLVAPFIGLRCRVLTVGCHWKQADRDPEHKKADREWLYLLND